MWWILLAVSVFLLFLLTPATPLRESFSYYDGIKKTPPMELIRNGQAEEEAIHRNDVLSRITPYIPTEDVHS